MKDITHLEQLHKIKHQVPINESTKKEKRLPQDMVCHYIGNVSIGGVIHSVYLTDWKFSGGEYGHIVPSANKIYLSVHQDPHNMLITLIHEMLHKVMEEYQLHRIVSEVSNPYALMEAITETLDKPITNDLLLSQINYKMFRRILSGELSKEP